LERLSGVVSAPGQWQIGRVIGIKPETPRVKSFRISVPSWVAHLPGQHYEVRLTAPDGYTAQRSYSIASSPLDQGEIELTIDRLDDGEVSPYFHDVVAAGDDVELRGPFASYFVWRGESPTLLAGGGSGIVPLMSMLRHRRRTAPELSMKLLYSVRSPGEIIYADELGQDALITLTRAAPEAWEGHRGRIDGDLIAEAGALFTAGQAFVCGSNGFVESTAGLLLAAGYDADRIRTERFGPSGQLS
jgi:ferredoxin-NADP reductase